MRSILSLTLFLSCLVTGSASEPKTAFPPMPEAFSSFGAAVADGHVYVYGGHIAVTHTYSTDAVTGKFRRLNLNDPKASWEELPPGPGLQGLALVAHQGKLYRIGGMQPRNKPGDAVDNHSVATVAIFDPKTKTWSDGPNLPAGRSSHDAVAVGDHLVVVGGWNMTGREGKNTWHDTALVLDLASTTPQWTPVPQPFKRRALNAAAAGGHVYVVGGMNADNDVEKRVDAFDVKSRTWSTVAELPGPNKNGFTPAACTLAGALVASPADGKIYHLSPQRDAWIPAGQLDDKRLVHRIVPLGDHRLLVLGGASRSGNLNSVELIDLMAGK